MSGVIEQALRLTIAGNALLHGLEIGRFWPDDDAFRFCREVRFVEETGEGTRVVVDNPDDWLQLVSPVDGLRLHHVTRGEDGASDRMTAGFADGGARWFVDAIMPDGEASFWEPYWEVVGDPMTAGPKDRIWSVTWWRVPDRLRPSVQPSRPLASVAADLRNALDAIASFAERAAPDAVMPGWAPIFQRAIAALADHKAREGDPGPPGFLTGPALGLLHAWRAGWVFGGMGSWNDGAYWGEAEAEGDALSERLFQLLGESVTAAANSTCRRASG
jgi:hypothetical protein